MKIIDNKKYRKIFILISIPLLIILQYYFFKAGILRPMVKGVEINIVKGDYVTDIDHFVIKLNDEVTLSSGDYISIPSYAKEPNIWFNVLDNSGTLEVKEDKLIAMKEGTSTVGIMKNSRVLRKANVKVVDPKVQKILVNTDSELEYVGDSTKISSIIEVDYDKFKEKEKATYQSSDKNIIKVTKDKIEAVGVGKATVYAKAQDKEEILEFNIKAKVSKIDIEDVIEIKVGQEKKLNPKITTNPTGLKHPKVEYEWVKRKLDVQKSIRLDNNGTIVGIREGEDKIKITCDGKSKIITIKVVEESLTNSKIENLEVNHDVVDNKLQISLEWDYIEGILDYEIHLRNNALQEREFKVVKSIRIDEKELILSKRIKSTIEVDLIDGKIPDVSMKVVGKTKFGTTKPSDIINIKPSQETIEEDIQDLEVKELQLYIDEKNNVAKFNWNAINIKNVQYSIYTKNNLTQDSGFILLESGIQLNEYTMKLEDGEIDIDIYVKANQGAKYSKDSNIVNVKIESINED